MLNNEKINNDIVLMEIPIIVVYIFILLFPMASKLVESGACIYWIRQIGAKNLI